MDYFEETAARAGDYWLAALDVLAVFQVLALLYLSALANAWLGKLNRKLHRCESHLAAIAKSLSPEGVVDVPDEQAEPPPVAK